MIDPIAKVSDILKVNSYLLPIYISWFIREAMDNCPLDKSIVMWFKHTAPKSKGLLRNNSP
jgi:hypothetical protein